jgi:hypothetical protein
MFVPSFPHSLFLPQFGGGVTRGIKAASFRGAARRKPGRGKTESSARYSLLIGEEAREQLRALPKPLRRNMGQRLEALQDGLAGEVKKLTAREHKYRLRAGGYRVPGSGVIRAE